MDGKVPARSAVESSSVRFWAYAAVFGGLWGAAEVGLGSALHALKVPMTGRILTCIGIVILASQRRLLPRRGLCLASGTVAALCKSISPVGIVFGPMIAIFIEALCFEIATVAMPRSRWLAALGGTLAMWWTLVHGMISQVVFFGARVMELYLEMLRKVGAFLGLEAVHGWIILALVAGLLAIAGSGAAELGRALGDAARSRVPKLQQGKEFLK